MEPEEEVDAPEVLETPEEEIELADPEAAEEEPDGETVETLSEKNKQLFARAKKAEGFQLVDGKWVKKTTAPVPAPASAAAKPAALSQQDLYVLVKADVPPEDVSEVTDYATLKGISVAAALKTNVVKTILADKAEERRSAEAANTGRARRASGAVTDESLLENARKGSLPDTSEGIERVIRARKGYKN